MHEMRWQTYTKTHTHTRTSGHISASSAFICRWTPVLCPRRAQSCKHIRSRSIGACSTAAHFGTHIVTAAAAVVIFLSYLAFALLLLPAIRLIVRMPVEWRANARVRASRILCRTIKCVANCAHL